MPSVRYPSVLSAIYQEASRLIAARAHVPTDLVMGDPDVYRSFPLEYFKLTPEGVFPRSEANKALLIRDEGLDTNRFSGQSFSQAVPPSGGLYCTFGQPALVAEVLQYARAKEGRVNREIGRDPKTGFPRAAEALAEKCVIRIQLMSSFMALDLSPHNPGARKFLNDLESAPSVQSAVRMARAPATPFWTWMSDGWDYTVARGIGLAVASSDYLHALRVNSARHAERSSYETGDNLIFFGHNGTRPEKIFVREAFLIPVSGPPERYAVL